MRKYLNMFRILYLILLLFVLVNFYIELLWLCLYTAPVESLAVSWSCDGF